MVDTTIYFKSEEKTRLASCFDNDKICITMRLHCAHCDMLKWVEECFSCRLMNYPPTNSQRRSSGVYINRYQVIRISLHSAHGPWQFSISIEVIELNGRCSVHLTSCQFHVMFIGHCPTACVVCASLSAHRCASLTSSRRCSFDILETEAS